MATGLFRMQHGPSGPAIGQLDVREHQYALWFGLNPLKVCWGRSRTPPASMSAASRGRCRGSSRGCCGRLCGTRRAGHGPRGPLGPVGCGGGRGAPPCASHRPISTLERPYPAAMGGVAGRGVAAGRPRGPRARRAAAPGRATGTSGGRGRTGAVTQGARAPYHVSV